MPNTRPGPDAEPLPATPVDALPHPGSRPLDHRPRAVAASRHLADGDELLDDCLGTMRRLRHLAVAAIHPGHGPSFDRARLRQICDHYVTSRSADG